MQLPWEGSACNIYYRFILEMHNIVFVLPSLHFCCVQLLIKSGRSPEEALMILVPEAYKNHPTLMIKYPEVIYICNQIQKHQYIFVG